ncbi:glycosyltransferase family 9 protein [Uliginosibacterium sp. sgz301328]|uniref:glycosyltransferase family 9 protein n=1 Tax=Uliginosibacterium sp. sgz301328 TaxID=3243764 RepID=UPI00359D0CC1
MSSAGVHSIVVFRALQLGDMLCSVPALRALRRGYPQARIVLVGLPSAAGFVDRYGESIDELVPFPGMPGLPEQPVSQDRREGFFDALRERRFDLAIQMHGDGSLTNAIVAGFGARRTVGFVPHGSPPREGFIPWPDDLPEPLRYLALTRSLGLADEGPAWDFPLRAEDLAEAGALRAAAGLREGAYVCLHGGARLPSRRWPTINFAHVGQSLVARGWPLVLTGSSDEGAIAADLHRTLRAMGCAATMVHDMAGRTSLGGMAALMASSRLLVSNDTGVSHLAAALRHPSVIVACGSDVHRWAPLDAQRHRVLWADAPCRPCAFEVCPYGHACAWNVTPAAVLAQIDAQLEEATDAAA